MSASGALSGFLFLFENWLHFLSMFSPLVIAGGGTLMFHNTSLASFVNSSKTEKSFCSHIVGAFQGVDIYVFIFFGWLVGWLLGLF